MSRFQEVVELLKLGTPKGEVAKRLGLKPSSIKTYESRARTTGLLSQVASEIETIIRLPLVIQRIISDEAAARDCETHELMIEILSLVARDSLFKAVIDD